MATATPDLAPGWPARAAELVERDGVRVYAAAPATVPGLLDEPLRSRPGAPAIAPVPGGWLSYEQLAARVEAFAAGLQERYAVAPGERVALLLANGVDFCVSLLGTLLAGAVAVPLNTKYAGSELAKLVADSGARVLLAAAEWREKVDAVRRSVGVEQVAIEGGAPAADPLESVAGTRLERPPVRPGDPAMIFYTSGTTGLPKGAVLTHSNVVNAALTYARCLELGPEDTTVVAVPLFHVTGLNGQLLPILSVGGAARIMPRFDAEGLVALLTDEDLTFVHATPAVYLLSLAAAGGRRARRLRLALCGGGAISPASIERVRRFAPGLDFRTVYGLTETSSPATLMPPGRLEGRSSTSGIAVPVNDVRIDAPGGPGEVLVRGATVAAGYHGDPEATERVFGSGWLRTGDVGVLDEAGFLTIVDRSKDMVNRGGEKVSSLEVERVLYEHPAVVECAVVARPDVTYGEIPHAVVVLGRGESVGASELARFAGERLARFKVPATFEFVDELPRNPGGKVLKDHLRGEAP